VEFPLLFPQKAIVILLTESTLDQYFGGIAIGEWSDDFDSEFAILWPSPKKWPATRATRLGPRSATRATRLRARRCDASDTWDRARAQRLSANPIAQFGSNEEGYPAIQLDRGPHIGQCRVRLIGRQRYAEVFAQRAELEIARSAKVGILVE
jgi:hypothetical protein